MFSEKLAEEVEVLGLFHGLGHLSLINISENSCPVVVK